LIELRHCDTTVGLLVGAPEDWSSYYVRVFALRPDFQRPELARRFARECLFAPLAERGVERVIADTSPANVAMSRLLTELHFHVTGSDLSDRWGPMTRYTRFLSARCEAEFVRKFGGGTPPNLARDGRAEKERRNL
jgi:RimJ/RimL family protein N-acetyltransferase